VRCKKPAFTLVELLTVLAIVAILIGLLIPSLTVIRNTAKEAKQKSQFTEIGLALTAFRNDYGDYPPSSYPNPPGDYCGAQKLAEALLGRDLLGFHPKSDWTATNLTFYPAPPIPPQNLDERRGPYLELGTESAFRLGDLFGTALTATTPQLAANTYVICDSFGVKKVTISPGYTAKAGMPILYYRADTTKKTFDAIPFPPPPGSSDIYKCADNFPLIQVAELADGTQPPEPDHPLSVTPGTYFYDPLYKIVDQKIWSATGKRWPHRPDSYILISAGMDGKYGTEDDICNFGN
jgi:prepilin-type N-terminal cleavage/methylation domain-containing protein